MLGLQVLEDASAFSGRTAYGPASALSLGLNRLELQLTADGALKGPSNHRVDLRTCNTQQLRALLQAAWGKQVANQCRHRTGLHEGLCPDPAMTDRLLRKLRPEQAPVIAKHIAGSFCCNVVKHKWDPGISPNCELCGAIETKEHRFLQRSATQHIRHAWMPYILRLFPHWLHGPYATVPEDVDMVQLVFNSRPVPTCVSATAVDLMNSLPRLRFYTDGSCSHPECPWARHCAWAVVLDLSHGQSDVEHRLQQWRDTRVLPPCFAVVAQGLVPGQQTINRAEQCAVIAAAKLTTQSRHSDAEVWSDSAYAICEHRRAVTSAPISEHPDLGNLLQQSKPECIHMEKVKSHQDMTCLEGMSVWHSAGNTYADEAAKAALKNDYAFLADAVLGIAQDCRKQADLLTIFHRFLLQLSEEEWRLKRSRQGEETALTADAARDKYRFSAISSLERAVQGSRHKKSSSCPSGRLGTRCKYSSLVYNQGLELGAGIMLGPSI